MIPPPNVTGVLHMGHVLDNALQIFLSVEPVLRVSLHYGSQALTMPPSRRK